MDAMNIYEEAVMYCLTANRETFVSPHFDIGGGWSRPDFVAIRPPKKKVYVVEVTAKGEVSRLLGKVRDRENQWFSQLREHLEAGGIVEKDWSYSVLAFIRCDQLTWFRERVAGEANVTALCLEDAIAHWEWDSKVSTPNFSFETGALKRAAQ